MPTLKQLPGFLARQAFDSILWILIGLFFLWSVFAIYYLTYLPLPLRVVLAIAFFLAGNVWLLLSKNRIKMRAMLSACCIIVFLATLFIRPSNDRDWEADHAQVANVLIDDGNVTIEHFRNCEYRSELDYTAHFQTKTFPLQEIESVWFLIQNFTEWDGMAHVFLSFGLKPGNDMEYFSVSVEIRREAGEFYSPFRGLFRSYELTHVIGDERDLIGVRTVHRLNDRVFMYRVNASPQQAQQLFAAFANRIGDLQRKPQFYHSFLNNCANGITGLTYELTPEPINWLDPRIVFPGHAAEFAFEHRLIGAMGEQDDKNEQFEQLRLKSRIDVKARECGLTDNFSTFIRQSSSE